VPIAYSQAVLGATIEIPTLTGRTNLVVPKGTQSHTELRVHGEGLPELRVDRRGQPVPNGRRGDLRVLVVIETPHSPTKRQEELLRELAEIEQKQVSGPRKGFLNKVKGWFASEEKK
jgi:molecular chaperone DnaJ